MNTEWAIAEVAHEAGQELTEKEALESLTSLSVRARWADVAQLEAVI